ncbi:MAG: MchE protein [Planctomycetota bacterium]|nr:MchE protein [Planctomycetota bacterium]
MNRHKFLLNAALVLVIGALAAGMFAFVYNSWLSQDTAKDSLDRDSHPAAVQDGSTPVRVSQEARKNLELVSKSLQPALYYRRIDLPGVITDWPGISDRGVVAPVTGIVTRIHAHQGDTIAPNAPLFSLRLVSESLHTSQLELFKASKEIEISRQQKQRLEGLAQSGAVAGSRMIEIDNQIQRMGVNVQAYRQDLLSRGLPPERIDAAAQGEFVTEIVVSAPSEQTLKSGEVARSGKTGEESKRLTFSFELQVLKVELGQQVEAGQVLCYLADHRALLIEGRGFKKDLPLIQQAAKEKLPIEVTFETSEGASWPPLTTQLWIEHISNQIDTASRTFAFYLPLENQWQTYNQNGRERFIWRFRPGDRVRLSVAVEKIENVFVLPQAALVREGPEAFVFRQNGDLFDRIGVHVLHEDSTSVVIPNDGKLRKGSFIAQNAAASLNRVLKAQLASGQPTNIHVHADGTTHAAH